MQLRKKYTKNIKSILLSFFILWIFSYLFIFADKFKTNYNIRTNVSAAFFDIKEDDFQWLIPLSSLGNIDPDDIKFIYIVQPGDSLSSIAKKFNITVSTLKSVNKLKSDIIRPWQKLFITDEEWILYEVKERITIKDFAKKYWLNLEELKKENYFSDDDLVLEKGDEIFIPISEKEAIKKWLLQKQTYISRYKYKKKKTIKIPIYNPKFSKNLPRWKYKCKKNPYIVTCRYYNPRVVNLFAPWHCTRFVAIKKFPFINPHRQSRPWRWNAKEWYRNAKKAWFKVWKTPARNSIIVFRYWWRHYYGYWHVAIVVDVDRKNRKLLIEEMNYIWRFIADRRRISMDNPKIVGYIYY